MHLDQSLALFKDNGKVITGTDVITMDSIVKEGVMCTKVLVKENQIDRVASLYVLALKELWSNSENTFTNDSITSCALLLINTYPEWLPKEMFLMIRNGMACKYGKTYGKLNTIEVMRWAKEYDETDRVAYFEKKATEKPNSDWKDIHKDITDKLPKMQPKEAAKPFVPREKTEQEKLIQGWILEFDKIKKEQNREDIFIMVEGAPMNIDMYLEYKLEPQKHYVKTQLEKLNK